MPDDARTSGLPGDYLDTREQIRLFLFVLNVMRIIFGPETDSRVLEERHAALEEKELSLIGFPWCYLVIRPIDPGSSRPTADVEEISAAVRVLARHGMLMGDVLPLRLRAPHEEPPER